MPASEATAVVNQECEDSPLESCIEDGVTEWLEFNGFSYNLTHMNNLIRRLTEVLSIRTHPDTLKKLIQGEVTPWREERAMDCTLTDYNNLIRDLEDRLSALQQRINHDKERQHAC